MKYNGENSEGLKKDSMLLLELWNHDKMTNDEFERRMKKLASDYGVDAATIGEYFLEFFDPQPKFAYCLKEKIGETWTELDTKIPARFEDYLGAVAGLAALTLDPASPYFGKLLMIGPIGASTEAGC